MDILAIDDDPLMLHTVSMVLEESFGEIHTMEHPTQAVSLLENSDIKVILLDLNFAIGDSDGAEGLAWIKRIKEMRPAISIVVLTAHGFLDVGRTIIETGSHRFYRKTLRQRKAHHYCSGGMEPCHFSAVFEQ